MELPSAICLFKFTSWSKWLGSSRYVTNFKIWCPTRYSPWEVLSIGKSIFISCKLGSFILGHNGLCHEEAFESLWLPGSVWHHWSLTSVIGDSFLWVSYQCYPLQHTVMCVDYLIVLVTQIELYFPQCWDIGGTLCSIIHGLQTFFRLLCRHHTLYKGCHICIYSSIQWMWCQCFPWSLQWIWRQCFPGSLQWMWHQCFPGSLQRMWCQCFLGSLQWMWHQWFPGSLQRI